MFFCSSFFAPSTGYLGRRSESGNLEISKCSTCCNFNLDRGTFATLAVEFLPVIICKKT